jgi:hypothetical protein
MTRYLLDTNMVGHFIDHRRGVDERARDARARGTVIGTCMPVVAELFYGVEFSASREINRPRFISCNPRSNSRKLGDAHDFGRILIERGRPLARNRELGRKYGVKCVEAIHYIWLWTSLAVDDYVRKYAVLLM